MSVLFISFIKLYASLTLLFVFFHAGALLVAVHMYPLRTVLPFCYICGVYIHLQGRCLPCPLWCCVFLKVWLLVHQLFVHLGRLFMWTPLLHQEWVTWLRHHTSVPALASYPSVCSIFWAHTGCDAISGLVTGVIPYLVLLFWSWYGGLRHFRFTRK